MHYDIREVPPNEWARIAKEHANAAPGYLPQWMLAEAVGRRTCCVVYGDRTTVYVEVPHGLDAAGTATGAVGTRATDDGHASGGGDVSGVRRGSRS